MKALVCTAPRKFDYISAEKPVLKSRHAVIKVKRVGICGTDLHAFEGTQPFFNYPRILGHELAGELTEFDDAPGFKAGETVSFIPYLHCGSCVACRAGKTNCCSQLQVCGVHIDGGMVEYLSVPSALLLHGQGLSLDELTLVEPLAIGAHGVRRAAVQPGEYVLIIGAGPIGLATIEFAKIAGGEVIAMDINEKRLRFCREQLNVAYTVNASMKNVTDQLREITRGDMPTVIIDATGSLSAINNAFQYMAHAGRYVLIGLQKAEISFSHPEFHKREGALMSSRNATRKDFEYVISALQRGDVRPGIFITHRVNFDQIADEFEGWLNPAQGVIKVMVELP